MADNKNLNTHNNISNDIPNEQKKANVPNLRFLNFTDEWYKSKFKNVLQMLKNNTLSRSELNYINGIVKNIHYGDVLIKFGSYIKSDSHLIPFINYENTPKKYKESLLKNGDIIIADTAEDETVGKATEIIMNDNSLILSGLHTIPCRPIQNKFASKYLGYYINSPSFHRQLLPLIQGIKVSSISKTQICETCISYPNQKEQSKITNFFTLIDQRLETQSKIIKELKSYKNLIQDTIVKSIDNNIELKLKDCCSISTGKLNANAMVENGKYKFFTCAKEDYTINSYSFDGESLLISGNGEVGLIKYYNGKFDAYQRTYVLQNFTINPLFLKFYLDIVLPKIIFKEKNVGAMPYIVLGTLENIIIKIPDKSLVNKISNLSIVLDKKIAIEEKILNDYQLMKKYLLSNMFI